LVIETNLHFDSS